MKNINFGLEFQSSNIPNAHLICVAIDQTCGTLEQICLSVLAHVKRVRVPCVEHSTGRVLAADSVNGVVVHTDLLGFTEDSAHWTPLSADIAAVFAHMELMRIRVVDDQRLPIASIDTLTRLVGRLALEY